ncbi:MAG: hypothetical protein K9K30_01975 [Burkholderiaceae bacterium]|nr:hypothetical protein [Sulfuritalea sp.]MCF8173984.1 hypothetical protein [Burkholderiaceae bacterium]MCF8183725.1 hypothetical protein [Polynucleobacter sp.]
MTKLYSWAETFHFKELPAVEPGIASRDRMQALFAERIMPGHELLLDAKIRVTCIDPARGRPIPMPRALHDQFAALLEP